MPRKLKPAESAAEAVAKPADTSAPAAPESDPLRDSDRDALQSLMAELAGTASARVTVYRATRNQPLSYMYQCDPASFSLDELRDKHNGGEFRVYITREGVLWKNLRVSVEPPHGGRGNIEPPSAQSELAAAMREGFAQQSALMREVLLTAKPKPVLEGLDIPALITAAAAALTTLRQVVTPPPPPPPPPPSELSGIDMLLKGIELANQLREDSGGGGGGEPGLMSIVRDLIRSPMLGQAVAAAASPPAPVHPHAPVRPPMPPKQIAFPTVPAASTQPHHVNGTVPAGAIPQSLSADPTDETLRPYLAALLEKAQAKSAPGLYAELIADSAPESLLASLLDGDTMARLIRVHPPVAEQRGWFEQLVAELRALFADDEGEDDVIQSSDADGLPAPDVRGDHPSGN